MSPTVVVDVANVMGARPDGWWRDRAGAAARLRREITGLATFGVAAGRLPDGLLTAAELAGIPAGRVLHPHWVLVLEGRARAAMAAASPADTPLIRTVAAPGSGDDEIVRQAATRSAAAPCLVVTADRELCRRCEAVGAHVTGPGWLLGLLSPGSAS